MNFWENPVIKSLGWKEEPKGIAKVMSVCMLIVIIMAIFLNKVYSLIILINTCYLRYIYV